MRNESDSPDDKPRATPGSPVPARFLTRGRLATWALLPLALLAMGIFFSPDRLLLYPTTDALSSIGAAKRSIPFEGGPLEIWIGHTLRTPPSQRAEGYILRFYGNADRADANTGVEALEWQGRPVEIWGVNYPGYGGSAGPARLDRIGPAALAAYDALKTVAGDRPLIVYGTSLGAAAALHVAARRAVAGVVLQNPPPLRQIVLRQFGWWNLWLIAGPIALRIPAALDSVANARRVRAPGVFVLSERDQTVQPRFQRLVVEAYAGPKRVLTLPGADHNDPLDGATQAALYSAVDAWPPAR